MYAIALAVLLSLGPGKASVPQAPGFAQPQIPNCEVATGIPFALCQYGTRSEIVAGKQKITPLYAIVSKNTNRAEQLSTEWMKYFAEYALDGEIFVRTEESPAGAWKVVAYRRPKDADQAGAWLKNKTIFSEEKSGDKSILPAAIRTLPEESLSKTWYIIHYFDGSAKVYLLPGTTTGEASDVLKSLPGAK